MTGEQAALIGLDWGTTSFRAYRIDAAGRVLEQRERDAGILKVQDGDFRRHPPRPSATGWQPRPTCRCWPPA